MILNKMLNRRIVVIRKTRPMVKGTLLHVSYADPEKGVLVETLDDQLVFTPFDQIVEVIADSEPVNPAR